MRRDGRGGTAGVSVERRRMARWPAAPRRPRLGLVVAMVAGLISAAPALAAAGQPAAGDVTLRAGPLVQRVTFDFGYGEFLTERFGAEFVDLAGVALSGVYWEQATVGMGLELHLLEGGFDYLTLNGQPRRAEFRLVQLLARAEFAPGGNWAYGLGAGLGRLTRSLEGFGDAEITADNLPDNRGVAKGETFGPVLLGDVRYGLAVRRLNLEVGVRYSVALHHIPSDDPRPALDDTQRPEDALFNVGGIAYLFTVAVRF